MQAGADTKQAARAKHLEQWPCQVSARVTRHTPNLWTDLDMGGDIFTQADATEETSGREEVQKLQWIAGLGEGGLAISISRQVLFIL